MVQADQTDILIVDDNAVDGEAARRHLQATYRVDTVTSGAEAVAYCVLRHPRCVLLDYRLPDTDGFSVLPQIIESGAAVVMLTGQGDERLAVECLQRGAHDYLPKRGLSQQRLERAIRLALDKVEMQRELSLHRQIVRHMPIATLVYRRGSGGHFGLTWHNRAAATIGWTELVGHRIGPSDDATFEHALHGLCTRTLEAGEAGALPTWRPDAEGHRAFDVRSAPAGDGLIVLLVTEVSEQQKAMDERRIIEQRMRSAQRLEAIGRLAGGVAHDFNNLLTVVVSSAEFLEERLPDSGPEHDDVVAILDSARRAGRLTSQLLTFSRQQPQALRDTSLNESVRSAEGLLGRVLGASIELRVELEPALGAARIDVSQFEQVVVNLAVNARDAMPNGGVLTVRTQNVETVDVPHMWPAARDVKGPWVMLSVTDNGVGMDPMTRERAFEPFFTTKGAGLGSGLGLATVHGIVVQSQGLIDVDSRPGHGTTFRIYLPRVEATTKTEATALESVPPGREETILVVEDEPMVRRAVCRILESGGYVVLQAPDGASALDVSETHAGTIDLLLTDIVMPGMSGTFLARQIVASRPSIAVVFASGYAEGEVGGDGPLPPAHLLLSKPFSGAALLRLVRSALDASAAAPIAPD